MKKAILLFAVAAVAATTVPAFSETTTQAQKDECLLASRNCMNQVDDIYQRMHRLDKEIKKGTAVYSPQELQKLREKLSEVQELLHDMEKPGH